jgi:tRNA modification GTPase
LRRAIAQLGWRGERLDVTRPHLASARHADAVARAREALAFARATVAGGEPLDGVVPELVAATAALGEITGAAATEAVLDGIFARFCVGK